MMPIPQYNAQPATHTITHASRRSVVALLARAHRIRNVLHVVCELLPQHIWFGVTYLGRFACEVRLDDLLELCCRHLNLVPLSAEGVPKRLQERIFLNKAPVVQVVAVEEHTQVDAARANNRRHADEDVLALRQTLVIEVGVVAGEVVGAGSGNAFGHAAYFRGSERVATTRRRGEAMRPLLVA